MVLCSLSIVAQDGKVTRQKKQETGTIKKKTVNSKSSNVYTVSTAEQFLNAIGSNRTIRVAAGFNLSQALNSYANTGRIKVLTSNSYFTTAGAYVHNFGDTNYDELTLYNIQNLTIEGTSMATAHLQIEEEAAFVLAFDNCSNIKLRYLTLGHIPQGYCGGGVIEMNNCQDFTIENCDLYGCGTEGISADGSDHCIFKNSTIRDCSYHIMHLNGCNDFHFSNSRFIRNKEFDLINVSNCSNVDFTSCKISQNKGKLFNLNCNVTFKGCTINHDSSSMGTSSYAIIR